MFQLGPLGPNFKSGSSETSMVLAIAMQEIREQIGFNTLTLAASIEFVILAFEAIIANRLPVSIL